MVEREGEGWTDISFSFCSPPPTQAPGPCGPFSLRAIPIERARGRVSPCGISSNYVPPPIQAPGPDSWIEREKERLTYRIPVFFSNYVPPRVITLRYSFSGVWAVWLFFFANDSGSRASSAQWPSRLPIALCDCPTSPSLI